MMMTLRSKAIPVAMCLALLGMTAACRGDRDTANTGATTPVRVTDVTLGRAIGGDKAITDRTDSFRPNDTIYASVATEGSATSATLRARWLFEDGQVVDESTQTIAPSSGARSEFHIAKPSGWPPGKYKVELSLDNKVVETKDFEVEGS